MEVSLKLKCVDFETDDIIVKIPDDYIVEALELENISEFNLADHTHTDTPFDMILDNLKNEVSIEDFKILNPEKYTKLDISTDPEGEDVYIPKYNLKRV